MKNNHFIFFIFLICIRALSASSENFNFPLQIGNKWFLQGNNPGMYDHVITHSVDDTIRLDGKLYFDINPGLGMYTLQDVFYRTDSLGNLLQFYDGTETILCNFNMNSGSTILMNVDTVSNDSGFCFCIRKELKPSLLGDERLNIEYGLNWSSTINDLYTYLNVMDGVGLSGIGWVWYDQPYYVIGAIINGQFYGDSVATSITTRDDHLRTSPFFQNYPNPFNPSTTIRFVLPKQENVSLHIIDLLGRRVRTLVENRMDAGEHSILWDGRDDAGADVAAGVYFALLRVGDEMMTIKLLLVR